MQQTGLWPSAPAPDRIPAFLRRTTMAETDILISGGGVAGLIAAAAFGAALDAPLGAP